MWSIFKKKDKPQTPVRTPVYLSRVDRATLAMLLSKHIAVAKIRGSHKQVQYLTDLREYIRDDKTL